MTRLHATVQLIAPRVVMVPWGEVARATLSASETAQCIGEHILAAAGDGTLQNGGCMVITVQREHARGEQTCRS